MSAHRTIGVDVGGTKTLAVLLDVPAPGAGAPRILARELVPSKGPEGSVLDRIRESVATLVAGSDRPVGAVGVGLAGFIGMDGVVHKAPNVPGLVGIDVGGALSAELGMPVRVDNDANCFAVASHALLDEPVRCLVAVTLGTGIGGGIVIDGALVRGAHGFAGEPGHMVIEADGLPCPCGQRGCWEAYASGSGLGRLARERCAQGQAPAVVAAAGSVDAVRGDHVTDLLDSGDRGATAIFAEYAAYVAVGFANLRVLLDPDVIALGGGLSAHGEHLLPIVEQVIARRFPSATVGPDCRFVVAPGGPDGGAVGAGILAATTLG